MIFGGILLNQIPPNLPVGYPTTYIGFAFFVFGISTNNAIKSAKKTNLISAKLEEIHEEITKKTNPCLKANTSFLKKRHRKI